MTMYFKFLRLLVFTAVLLSAPFAARAAEDAKIAPLDGTWRWNFTNADGGVIQPTLKVKTEDDGKLSGISRFRSGTSSPVTNFTLAGDQVSFEIARTRNGETTVTHYHGTLSGEKITGQIVASSGGEQWTHEWNAFRYGDIEGVWKWRPGGGPPTPGGRGGPGARRGGPQGRGAAAGGGEIALTIRREEGDNISGKINLGAGDQEIQEPIFHDSNLYFETSRTRSDGELSTNYYWGKLSKDVITGKYTTDAGGNHRTNDFHAARSE